MAHCRQLLKKTVHGLLPELCAGVFCLAGVKVEVPWVKAGVQVEANGQGLLGVQLFGLGVSFPGLEQAARPRRAKSDINRASFLNIGITPITFYILYIIS